MALNTDGKPSSIETLPITAITKRSYPRMSNTHINAPLEQVTIFDRERKVGAHDHFLFSNKPVTGILLSGVGVEDHVGLDVQALLFQIGNSRSEPEATEHVERFDGSYLVPGFQIFLDLLVLSFHRPPLSI